jgi:hypothetical protein
VFTVVPARRSRRQIPIGSCVVKSIFGHADFSAGIKGVFGRQVGRHRAAAKGFAQSGASPTSTVMRRALPSRSDGGFTAGQKRIGIAGPDLGYYVMRRSAL